MENKKQYQIVCLYPTDTWIVQERMPNGEWMEAHRSFKKRQDGLTDCENWIKEQEEKQ